MFCPNCSQEQISDDIKFCKSCGFPLADVSEALKNNGYVERNVVQSAKELKKDVTKGVVVITLSSLFFILSLIFGTPEPSYFVQFNLLIGVLCFIFGLILIGYSFFKKPVNKSEQENYQFDSRKQPQFVLENQKTEFLLNEKDFSEFVDVKAFDTSRLKVEQIVEQPPSVSEGTTKLLNKEE
jgi:hypothetical protein